MEADPEVRRWVGGAPRTREAAEEKFRQHSRMWAIVYKPEGRYIGYCRVSRALGYYLAREYWGRGLATEAVRALVDYGFRELGLTRIVASVETGNDASKHILEKLGFRLVRHEPGERRSFDHFELERSMR
jgi:RimJ/RimL family protein N-acetyltransferase